MARSENQKLKLLYLLDILREESDENHPLSTADLIEKLAHKGISAERKALYSDLAALEEYGIALEKSGRGHYIASRDYELAELKTLVDIIQSSRFLTAKKCQALTKKLYKQTSRYGAAELDRQVHTTCVKAPNEQIYYTVDAIHSAIRDDRRIHFSYQRYNEKKQLCERRPGFVYEVSPLALIFDNENYYLIAYMESESEIRHYRVDRMQSVTISEEKRSAAALQEKPDISKYENKAFGMFGGEETLLTLQCQNGAAGAIIDRFGEEPTFFCHPDGTFDVTVRVFVSEQFFGWLTGLGKLAKIKAPESAAIKYKAFLQELIDQ